MKYLMKNCRETQLYLHVMQLLWTQCDIVEKSVILNNLDERLRFDYYFITNDYGLATILTLFFRIRV